MDEVLTIEQVAALLSCDETTVAEHLRRGLLPGLKFGRHWVVPARTFFARVNDLADEQAAERRARIAKLVAVQVPPVKRGGRRNIPPVLPTLQMGMHNPGNP